MATSVRINEKLVGWFSTHTMARIVASEIYEAYCNIIIEGYTNFELAAQTLHKYLLPGEDLELTVGGRNWEEFIAKENRIDSLLKTA